MDKLLEYPFNNSLLLKKHKFIRRELSKSNNLVEKRIAILGGSTTNLIKDFLELFLLNKGIKPIFYESDYNKYFEDAIFGNITLDSFNPDYIYIHTTYRNINFLPPITSGTFENTIELIENFFQNFIKIWDTLSKKFECSIIQNNFEYPPRAPARFW